MAITPAMLCNIMTHKKEQAMMIHAEFYSNNFALEMQVMITNIGGFTNVYAFTNVAIDHKLPEC